MLYIKRIILKTLFLLLFLTTIISCTTTKIIEVPIETIKTEYIEQVKYDSIYSKDSIYIMQKGDTIYNNKVQYLYKYKYLRDTINITDTIPKIITVKDTQYINQLYAWQKILIVIGIGFILYWIIKLVIYIKSKFNMMLKKWFGIAHFNKSYKMKRE